MSSYSYYSATPSYGSDALFAGLAVFVILLYILLIGVSVASYVLNALALQRIAKRRQIRNPFLAWIPFASSYLLGSIADEYDAKNGKNHKWRKNLLIASIAPVVLFILFYISMILFAFSIPYGEMGALSLILYIFAILLFVVLSLVATLQTIFNGICMYKIFESIVPEKTIKYLILYLVVPLAGPLCLFKCKDLGYSNVVEAPIVEE